jgi:hypothetical protein
VVELENDVISDLFIERCPAVSDPTAAPGHHRSNTEHLSHLTRLEGATLRTHERDAVTMEFEAGGEVSRVEHATARSGEPIDAIACCLSELRIYA